MSGKQRIAVITVGLAALLMVLPAHAFNLNKSISVDDGATSSGESTVNGSITVGSDAVVKGSLDTVNGTIRVEENATIEDAQTVNGSLRVASGCSSTDLSSVNGSIRIGEKVTVNGEAEPEGRATYHARTRRDLPDVSRKRLRPRPALRLRVTRVHH